MFGRLGVEPVGSSTLLSGAVLVAARGCGSDPAETEAGIASALDRLAHDVQSTGSTPTIDDIMATLFADGRLRGNAADYYDPQNSYLNQVLDRGLGIPITLAVVAIEVARRCDVELVGVSMPGHFLVSSGSASVWYDCFDGGSRLDVAACAARFRATQGPDAEFSLESLAPVGPLDILGRMVTNLVLIGRKQRDHDLAVWAALFRARLFPGVAALVLEAAASLGAAGHYAEAATELEVLAVRMPEHAENLRQRAAGFRARLN